MKKIIIQVTLSISVICLLFTTTTSCNKKNISVGSISGCNIPLVDTFDNHPCQQAVEILDHYYQIAHEYIDDTIGFSDLHMTKKGKESVLGNFTTDALLTIGQQVFDSIHIDISLINNGGIRTDMLDGYITVGNIVEIFPFDNYLTVIALRGSDVRKLFGSFVKNNKYESFAGVRLVVKNNEIQSIKINGKPLDDNKIYNISTVDYVAEGGDRMSVVKNTIFRYDSNISIRDAIIEYVKDLTAQGKHITGKLDGRLVIK